MYPFNVYTHLNNNKLFKTFKKPSGVQRYTIVIKNNGFKSSVLNETAVADFLFCCRVNNEEKQNKANSKYTTVINILLIILYTFKLGICKYFKKIVQLILFRLQALAGSQTHIIKQCEQC